MPISIIIERINLYGIHELNRLIVLSEVNFRSATQICCLSFVFVTIYNMSNTIPTSVTSIMHKLFPNYTNFSSNTKV